MKRFYKDVTVEKTDLGWAIALDGRPLKTQGGQPQVMPSEKLAEMLAEEWRAQGEEIDPASFRYRDMADYALDVVAKNPSALIEKLLGYAETDTLCYRADPEDALYRRQQEVWEPIVCEIEEREGCELKRVSGIIHRPQSEDTLSSLRRPLTCYDPFTLAGLEQLISLTASYCIGIAALNLDVDGEALWDAANLEEDWQAQLWGRDEEAEERRSKRKGDFLAAIEFTQAARALT